MMCMNVHYDCLQINFIYIIMKHMHIPNQYKKKRYARGKLSSRKKHQFMVGKDFCVNDRLIKLPNYFQNLSFNLT